MLFPHKLKRDITAEELLALLNQKTWADGGKFELAEPEQVTPFSKMGYIVYTPYEDPHYAVAAACYYVEKRIVYHIKAYTADISGFSNQLKRDLVGDAIGRATGTIGLVATGIATGAFKHKKAAKKLSKRLNAELKAYLTEQNLW